MDDVRDDFEEDMEKDLVDSVDEEDALLGDDEEPAEDETEDKLLDQFGLHRVDEEEESEF